MSFSPDPNKQEVTFNRKLKNSPHPLLIFNSIYVFHSKSQKRRGIALDSKLTFEEQCKTVLCKTNRIIGLLHELQNLLPKAALLTIYKTFVRPHFSYGDVLFDQAFHATFHKN